MNEIRHGLLYSWVNMEINFNAQESIAREFIEKLSIFVMAINNTYGL